MQSFQQCFDLDAVLPRPNSISKSVLWEQAPSHAEFFTKVRPPCQSRSVFLWLHTSKCSVAVYHLFLLRGPAPSIVPMILRKVSNKEHILILEIQQTQTTFGNTALPN